MKPQTIINIVFAVAFVGYVVWQRNPTFGTITCKKWRVVDEDGKMRIIAAALANGQAGVQWYDTERHCRITAETYADGRAYLPTKDENPPKKP